MKPKAKIHVAIAPSRAGQDGLSEWVAEWMEVHGVEVIIKIDPTLSGAQFRVKSDYSDLEEQARYELSDALWQAEDCGED